MSETLMKTVIDCSTGVEEVLPLTPEEVAQFEADAAAAEARYLEREAAAAAKAAAKAAAHEKLAALGLSADEIAAL